VIEPLFRLVSETSGLDFLVAPSPWLQQKAPPAANKQPLDINSASADELKALTGIGEADAKKIVEDRPYKSTDELVQKKVMPKATYDKIKDQIVAK
jgi:competence protein ComEA